MEVTALTVAAELKRQIDSKMPSRPLKGGGMREFSVKASFSSAVSEDVFFEALGVLLVELGDAYPEWQADIGGDPEDLEVTFSR